MQRVTAADGMLAGAGVVATVSQIDDAAVVPSEKWHWLHTDLDKPVAPLTGSRFHAWKEIGGPCVVEHVRDEKRDSCFDCERECSGPP